MRSASRCGLDGSSATASLPPWNEAAAATVRPSPPAATSDIRPPRQYPVVPIADPLTSDRLARLPADPPAPRDVQPPRARPPPAPHPPRSPALASGAAP